MVGRAEREDTLLGAALFFIAPGAAKGGVETVFVQSLLERLGFHHIGMQRRAVCEWANALGKAIGIGMHQEFESQLFHPRIAVLVHRLELPAGIDVQQWEGRPGRIERLHSQVQHHRAVFADRIEHHRVLALGDNLSHDVDAFGFQQVEMPQAG